MAGSSSDPVIRGVLPFRAFLQFPAVPFRTRQILSIRLRALPGSEPAGDGIPPRRHDPTVRPERYCLQFEPLEMTGRPTALCWIEDGLSDATSIPHPSPGGSSRPLPGRDSPRGPESRRPPPPVSSPDRLSWRPLSG